jgi:hypothetical protein
MEKTARVSKERRRQKTIGKTRWAAATTVGLAHKLHSMLFMPLRAEVKTGIKTPKARCPFGSMPSMKS